MKFPIAVRFGSGLALTILVLVAIYVSASDSITQSQANTVLARANRDYLQALRGLLQSVVDAESAQRGFLITNKASYLEPLEIVAPTIKDQIARIEALGQQVDADAAPGIARLADVTQRKFAELKQVLTITQTDRAAAFNLVTSDQGQRLTDSIRAEVNALIDAADLRLVQSREQTQRGFQRLTLLIRTGIIVSIALLAAIFVFGYTSIKRRIDELVLAARKFGAGDLDHRVVARNNDELSVLATAFNQMAGRLKDSNEALDSFAYTVSHDLRAPLRAMEGFSQALVEDYEATLGDIGGDYARRINDAARRMGELIQDLLAYSRLSRSDFQLRPEPLDDILREAENAIAGDITASGALVQIDGNFPRVIGHRATLRQIIVNILSNALKFVAPQTVPRIRVFGERRSGAFRLWIEDNGIGIAPEHYQRIFQIFERLHGIEAYPGTGIGLAIVGKGVERMGGRAGVEANPAGGSRFWLEFKMEDAA